MNIPFFNRKKQMIRDLQIALDEQTEKSIMMEQAAKQMEQDYAARETELKAKLDSFHQEKENTMAQLRSDREAVKKEAALIIEQANEDARLIVEAANEEVERIISEINLTKSKNEQYYKDFMRDAEDEANDVAARGKALFDDWTKRANLEIDRACKDREAILNGLSDYQLFKEFDKHNLAPDKIEYCITTKEELYFKRSIDYAEKSMKDYRKCGMAIEARLPSICSIYPLDIKPIVQLCLAHFDSVVEDIINNSTKYGLEESVSKIWALKQRLENSFNCFWLKISDAYMHKKMESLRAKYTYEEYKVRKKEEAAYQRNIEREEAKAQREYERAIKLAEKDEERARRMIEETQRKLREETNSEKRHNELEQQIKSLEEALSDAIQRSERAKSMAEQTRRGYVYIISNIGSFGEGVFKIGLTRRLDPTERVDELSNASVPFPFDVHAIIESEDAPALESTLHRSFDEYKLNKTNWRKEFFKVPLDKIEQVVNESGIQAKFIKEFPARQYRESLFAAQLKISHSYAEQSM